MNVGIFVAGLIVLAIVVTVTIPLIRWEQRERHRDEQGRGQHLNPRSVAGADDAQDLRRRSTTS